VVLSSFRASRGLLQSFYSRGSAFLVCRLLRWRVRRAEHLKCVCVCVSWKGTGWWVVSAGRRIFETSVAWLRVCAEMEQVCEDDGRVICSPAREWCGPIVGADLSDSLCVLELLLCSFRFFRASLCFRSSPFTSRFHARKSV
jgi:hypothetical protein